MGFAAVAWPVSATYTVAYALRDLYSSLLRDGTTSAQFNRMFDFDSFNSLIGLPALREREESWQNEAQDLVEGFGNRGEGD